MFRKTFDDELGLSIPGRYNYEVWHTFFKHSDPFNAIRMRETRTMNPQRIEVGDAVTFNVMMEWDNPNMPMNVPNHEVEEALYISQ